ncbi:uncharacterized protein LOC131602177 [Vicia villosa]|uniref:uncharacterized protein LOC131602177 n=1 Tax=Vicia villosa TaxID=3911 RepID=UPI00273C59EC|nr:uncharacterized protein LOC131602177 [Vicia villosa]
MKRQLPPWMMPKVAAASHVSNSGNLVEANCSTENGDVSAVTAGKIDHKKVASRRKLNSKAKCEAKGEIDLDERNESGDNVNEKKKKKQKSNVSRDSGDRRSTKKRRNLENVSRGGSDCDHECQVKASSDDDVELTVEDLMAIAEQYVKDYKDKETWETVDNLCEPKRRFPATTEAETTLDSSRENKKSSSLERDVLDTFASTAGRVIPTGSSQIDHPAQNMLDVFLGPLLRTTLEKEENWRRENLS